MTPTTIPAFSVHERDGHWSVFWRAGGVRFKRRVGPATMSRRAAKRRAGEIVLQHASGASPLPTKGTFADAARAYLEHAERVKGAKPSTLLDYRYLLGPDGAIAKALGDKQLGAVTPRDVERLLERIERGGASPRTVNKARGMVGAVFNLAVRKGRCGHNPVRATDRRREAQRPPLETYTAAEVEALARAATDAQDGEMFRVAAFTGLRQGELRALRWHDVGEGAIAVSRAMSGAEETDTKSHRVRHVPLPPQAAQALDRLRKRDDFVGDDELVFPDWRGRPLSRWTLTARYTRARETAGLRKLTFHGLRHSYGSMLASAGVPVTDVQAAMGHAHLSTTSIYLHARDAASQAEAFGRAFATKSEP